MKIAIGCDHRGLDFKKYVIDVLTAMGHTCQDCGTFTAESVDYPDIARLVGEEVAGSRAELGILICGTGIGMSIAANKIKKIRAALCTDAFSAKRARSHNNANVICLGAERGQEGVKDILTAFLGAQFEGGRHQARIDKMSRMEASC
jgi:ribose 5-phosphate isomerase B